MARFEHTIEIECPVDDVFAFVTQPQNYRRWQASLREVRPHFAGPLRVGGQATEVRRFLGREMETTWTCTEHEPSRRSTIESDDGPVPFCGTFTLSPTKRGTRFTWTVETRGAAARLAGPIAGRITKRELAKNSAHLKQILERGRGVSRRTTVAPGRAER